jgi:hypothetical protein
MAAKRVKRLKDLVDLLERLPASPDRDRVLSEVRSRAVDVDTGVTPRAMLPLREPAPAPAPVLPRPPKPHATSSIMRTAPPRRAPAVELAHPASAASRSKNLERSLWAHERLSLEDSLPPSPLPHTRAQGDRVIPPWTRGLRG